MMRVGKGFTWGHKRYNAGDRFRVGSLPPHLRGSFVRMFELTPYRKRRKDYLNEQDQETST